MFINNKYTKWYNSIIENAKSREISGYTEQHHILPRSFGGSNDPSNLVLLTAREHFVCHLLLTKMVIGKNQHKAIHAAWGMCNLKSKDQHRHLVSSRTYESLRIKHATILSEKYTGVKNPNKGRSGEQNKFYGKTHSDETKEKIRQARLGRVDSIEVKLKKSQSAKNRPPVTEITREKISKANKGRTGLAGEKNGFFGKTHSLEQREKKRQEKLATPKQICYYCNREIDQMNYSRWHGEKCKHKT